MEMLSLEERMALCVKIVGKTLTVLESEVKNKNIKMSVGSGLLSGQHLLQRLPVPDLNSTIEKYLK